MKLLKNTPLSILDLAKYAEGHTIADAYTASVSLAQHGERWGYKRFWLAEHHNLEGVASAATSILIGHVAQSTKTIRVGSGGIMLPNHAPMVIAEQFGTLATLFPGRIDLGLGRAPGTDQLTLRALRPDGAALSPDFAQLVDELLYFLAPPEPEQRIKAIPGAGLDIPIWILGSSLYSAQLAASLGRPYAFAGHFAPAAMLRAFEIYRAQFQPSAALDKPYVMVGVPIVAADTDERADYLATSIYQTFVSLIRNKLRPAKPPVQSMDGLWSREEEAQVRSMMSTLIVGGPAKVARGMQELVDATQADELIITSDVFSQQDRLHSYELIAAAAS